LSATGVVEAVERDHPMESTWTPQEIEALSKSYGIRPGCRLHKRAEDFHFPEGSFLRRGYSPPGGYVKDFSVVQKDGRLHVFHIDGRPGELCWITGNEISFGHASTADYQRWIRHPMPLAVGDRSWESEHVWAPFVYERDGRYYMFYMGTGAGETFISYATSADLERWQRWQEGPIKSAVGRDPFVLDADDHVVLLFTGHGSARIAGCVSRDMVTWEPVGDLLQVPERVAAESCSLHSLSTQHVLWFNDYREGLQGFRAAYVLSDNLFRFDPRQIREFVFVTDTPGVTPNPEFPIDKPVPLSIELIAKGDPTWFVSYFRWHIDRNRLFFGTIDWSSDPAMIREINTTEMLQDALEKCRER
jgi:hypothetical protein